MVYSAGSAVLVSLLASVKLWLRFEFECLLSVLVSVASSLVFVVDFQFVCGTTMWVTFETLIKRLAPSCCKCVVVDVIATLLDSRRRA